MRKSAPRYAEKFNLDRHIPRRLQRPLDDLRSDGRVPAPMNLINDCQVVFAYRVIIFYDDFAFPIIYRVVVLQ